MDYPLDLSMKSEKPMDEPPDLGMQCEDKVEVLGEYYPALHDVRCMYDTEALCLLQSRHGCLANTFSCVMVQEKDSFQVLPGRGAQLYLAGPEPERLVFWDSVVETMLHAVVLYRGLDGDYCFFDSTFYRSPCGEVIAAAQRSGPGNMYWC